MADEMRLINVVPVIKFIEDGLNNPNKRKAFGHDAVEILAEVEFAPTVDAVEVVRCKDCKQWCRNSGFADSPNGHCFYHDIDTNGCDFCSYGERKDENEDEG